MSTNPASRSQEFGPRRAFLTGASSGIGLALAKELQNRGWSLALAARHEEALRAVAEAAPAPTRTLVMPLDVADEARVRSTVDEAAHRLGGLDTVIANAGIGIPSPAAEIRVDDLRRVFDVNVIGASATLLAGLPHVRKSSGLLVGVSSIAAWRSGPGAAAYNASKAALSSFLEGIRCELADDGVRVLEVNPGFVRTPLTARNTFHMPFLVEPEDAARRIANAIERRKSHLVFPFPAWAIMSLARRLPDGLFDVINRRLSRRLELRGDLDGGQSPNPR